MKKLLLSIICLTVALAATDSQARLFGRGCGVGGCGPKACRTVCEPKCEARVCYMEPCAGPCPEPEEVTCERHIEYRKCVMLVPQESTYPVEVCCTTTKRCVITECPAGECGAGAPTVFSDGSEVTKEGSREVYTVDAAKGGKRKGVFNKGY